MRSRELSSLALLAAAAVAIAGCGGGAREAGPDQGRALSRAEFVRAATSLCKHSRQTTERRLGSAQAWLRPSAEPTLGVKEKMALYMVVVPAEALSEDLQRLGPVSGGDRQLEALAATLQKDVEKARVEPLTITEGTAFVASDTLAIEEGLSACVH